MVQPKFFEDPFNRVYLVRKPGVAYVDNMHEKVCIFKLFKGGPKGGDQFPREFSDEAHRVGNNDFGLLRESFPSARGIQCGKEPAFGYYGTTGQRVQQSRFSRIGVSYDRYDGQPLLGPFRPPLGPLSLDGQKGFFQMGDAFAYSAPVNLQFCLSGASPSDTSCKTRHGSAFAGESGKEILELGQLHLNFAFSTPSPLGKDVENELRPVYDLQFCKIGDGTDLGRV